MMHKDQLVLEKEYNFFDNKRIVLWLNVAGIILLVPMAFIFILLSMVLTPVQPFILSEAPRIIITSISLIVLFLTIIVHEAVHGIFFKVFNPQGKVKFGFKSGFAYAVSAGSIYNRGQMMVIGLASFVVLTLFFILIYLFGLINETQFIFFTVIHGSMCVGDFWYAYLLLFKHRGEVYVEDTESGISFYRKK